MLDKLINNIKQSLPGASKKKSEEEENTDDEHSDQENEDSHDTSDNGHDSSDGDAKKKRISMIIRVIAILALAYMGVTEFLLKEDPVDIPAVAAKPRRSRKRPPIVKSDTKGDKITGDTKTAECKVIAKDNTKDNGTDKKNYSNKTTPPVENINIADKTEEKIPEKAEDKKVEEKKIDEKIVAEEKIPAEEPVKKLETKASDTKTKEVDIDKKIDSMIDSVDKKDSVKEESKEKVGSSTDGAPKKEVKLEDMIVTDDAYTAPPAFDQLGRGLVYNCKEKYWACVDKVSYVACNKNMKWNKSHTKPIECVVQSVYNSDDDCGVVQKYNVSTNKETSFCQ